MGTSTKTFHGVTEAPDGTYSATIDVYGTIVVETGFSSPTDAARAWNDLCTRYFGNRHKRNRVPAIKAPPETDKGLKPCKHCRKLFRPPHFRSSYCKPECRDEAQRIRTVRAQRCKPSHVCGHRHQSRWKHVSLAARNSHQRKRCTKEHAQQNANPPVRENGQESMRAKGNAGNNFTTNCATPN